MNKNSSTKLMLFCCFVTFVTQKKQVNRSLESLLKITFQRLKTANRTKKQCCILSLGHVEKLRYSCMHVPAVNIYIYIYIHTHIYGNTL